MQDIEEHFKSLLQILARLRSPGGCPWDRAQSLESMRSCLLEETWEVLDAINQAENQADFEHLKEELGDLLLNVLLMIDIVDAGNQPLDDKHCVNFNEQHVFREVLAGLCKKLVSRHAHVFGTVGAAKDADEALKYWQKAKTTEEEKNNRPVLDSVAKDQAALLYALKLQKKAANFGFDWPCATASKQIGEKIREELEEFYEENEPDKMEEELGDILFSAVNLARVHSINPELALMRSSEKFRNRFQLLEENTEGRTLSEMSLEELEQLWEEVKLIQRAAK